VSTNKKDYDFRAFRPAVFVKELLDKIITGNGYTWESNFFNTNFAKRLIVPNNQDRLTTVKTQALQANYFDTPYNFVTSYQGINITNLIGNSFVQESSSVIKYVSTTATLNVNINLQLAIRDTSPFTTRGYVSLFKNGTEIIASRKDMGGVVNYLTNNYSYNASISFTNNDTLELRFSPYISIGSGVFIIFQSSINIFSSIPIVLAADLNDTISINSTLPLNIKQKDFFTSILKMFYLMVTEDKMRERHFIIEPWVDFYDNNRTTYLDWSDKVDRSEPIRIKPMSELNARFYQMLYKSDNDWKNEEYRKLYSEGYGDRIFDNGFEFAKETDKTEVIFSATPLIGYTILNVAVDKIVSAIYKKNNGLEQQVASNIRILQAKNISGKSNWFIQNRTPNSVTNLSSALTTYGYAGHLDNPDAPNSDLNFGATKELYFTLVAGALSNNLFNAYYSSYLAEITDKDSRLLTVKMKLTESDIYNLDFGRYILIDQVLYRLQKIIDYAPGELCKVQLLRVISTNYN
jgi:hypothetical protein